MNTLIKYANSLIELAYPRLCCACEDRLLEFEDYFCLNCINNLPTTDFYLQKDNPMCKKFWGRVPIENAFALYYFSPKSKVQKLIHHLKYKNMPRIGNLMGSILGKNMAHLPHFADIDIVMPIPLHAKKQALRGYNQADGFAQAIAKELKIAYSNQVLERITHTSTQTKKSRWERWQNVNTIFNVAQIDNIAQIGNLQHKHVLLVDDVMTTGATLESCAEKLLAIEGVKVSVATIAWAAN